MKAYFAIQKVIEEGNIEETEKWILKIEKINIYKNETNAYDRKAIKKTFRDYILGSEGMKNSVDAFSYINYMLASDKSFEEQNKVEQTISVTGIKVYEYLKFYIEESIKTPQCVMRNKNLVLLKKHFEIYEKIIPILDINPDKVQECIEKSQLLLLIGIKINKSNKSNNKLYFDMIRIIDELKKIECEIINEILLR